GACLAREEPGWGHHVGSSRRLDPIPGGASRLRLRCVSCFERWGTALPDHHDHARSSPGRRFCNRRRCVFSLLSPFPRDQSRENDVESRQWTGRPGLTAEPDSAMPDGSFTSCPHVHIYPHAPESHQLTRSCGCCYEKRRSFGTCRAEASKVLHS